MAKQANLMSNALSDLLQDEGVTRQATLQNLSAIDYLLLLHQHHCEEFEGLCFFNLSSRAADIHQAISKIKDMVREIKRETGDWLGSLFKNWGLSGWVRSIVKTGLLILLIIMILIAFRLIRRMIYRLLSNATAPPDVNHIITPSAPEEMMELEEVAAPENNNPEEVDHENFLPEQDGQWRVPFEDWPTNQQWFGDIL